MDEYGVLLPSVREPEPFARRLSTLGYDRLWVGELWGSDPFVRLARTADTSISIGTAVVNVYSRTPATIAQAAATVHETTGSDFVLGLGTSTPKAIGSIHGLEFDHPIRRLHETVELVRGLLSTEAPVDYEGDLVSTHGTPGLNADVPVYTAALGEAACRATGRVADGWVPHNVPFDRYETKFETIARTAREAGRDPERIAVVPYVPCAVSDDEAEARDAVRDHVCYYVGSGEGYRAAVAQSFPTAAERIADEWDAGNREAARAAVSDEMVATLGVAGTPENARQRFETALPCEFVDGICIVVPEGAPDLVDPTLEALAPAED